MQKLNFCLYDEKGIRENVRKVKKAFAWNNIFSSVLGIFSVNYFFTYPYYAINFVLAGYPLAFLSMLVISSIISTLTVKIKKQALLFAKREKQIKDQPHLTHSFLYK